MIETPRSICVLRLSAIGDVCHTLPVVRTLQDHWPQTHITWIIGKLENQLVGDIEGIEFIVYDKRGGRAARNNVARQLGERRFDILLHMQAALRASILSTAVRADIRLGFDRQRAKDWQWLFTNRRIQATHNEHVMDGLLGFANALGIPRSEPRWEIPLSATDRVFAENMLPENRKALIISPCSSQRARNFRNWPIERYVAVAEHARHTYNMPVLITGGPSELEKHYGERIAGAVPGARNLVGQTGLKQLHALLSRAAVLVSPDSGPVHMANAAGTPVVGLYATSNPDRTGPYFNRRYVVNRYPDAVEKYLGRNVANVSWGRRVRAADAMELITVDDVNSRLDLLMREHR